MAEERILVIDDQAANLKLARLVLQAEGFRVRTAADGEEGLEAARQLDFDLILLDLQLPGIDGFEIARRLKRDPVTREIPVIAWTAFAMHGDEERALAAGCDGYISKPIDTRTMAAALRRWLSREGR